MTISMIAVSRSSRIAQSVARLPLSIQRRIGMISVSPSKPRNRTHDRRQDRNRKPVAAHCAAASPMNFQPKPQISAPTSGAKRMIVSIASALHHVDVFDVDGAPVAEEADEDGEPDCRLRRRDRENEKREDLPDQIAQIGRERHEIDVDGKQHQFDRHQDDDDVLPVQEEAEDAYDEQRRRHREVMFKSDHSAPLGYPPKYPFATRIATATPTATAIQRPAFKAPAPA